ncbi:hypothetical protein J8273_4400 [Carpediemonas membranifera]|uniref:Uncharacterized protein n=1 Tax=Carpediemonas membranifera TaxID=201153 RepID=A0A8J6B6V2_9EUKA|nr:hypothetical protein J8273_4400 [Carpediemonas membranifera]|eukprot:KAG9394037.1 hypothetical protein J8273_4400 [Carpediemonas membranifera]
MRLVICAICIAGLAFAAGLEDALVFNPYYYMFTNADLLRDHINSKEAAITHWNEHGARECRNAHPTFDVASYFNMNPDVARSCNRLCDCGVRHFITNGHREGRHTWQQGNNGRYTIWNADKTVTVSTGGRMAGAIDSITYKGRELLNSYDHGRECQYAITVGYGECLNPTEAGSSSDGLADTTTSKLLGIRCDGSSLQTTSQSAFWLRPGEHEAHPSAACTVARNTQALSDYKFSKNVFTGYKGHNNVIVVEGQIDVPPHAEFANHFLQLEAPTPYTNGELTSFYTINVHTAAIAPYKPNQGETGTTPTIAATPDGSAALSIIAPQCGHGVDRHFAAWYFNEGSEAGNTGKLDVVCRWNDANAGDVYHTTAYIVVGTLDEVRGTIQSIASCCF